MFIRGSYCSFAGGQDRLVPSETQFRPQNLEPRIEEAEDEEDCKGALRRLIVAAEIDPTEHLMAELNEIKSVGQLKKRARAAGVTEEQIETAEDEEDCKGALRQLIVGAEVNASGSVDEGRARIEAQEQARREEAEQERAIALAVRPPSPRASEPPPPSRPIRSRCLRSR